MVNFVTKKQKKSRSFLTQALIYMGLENIQLSTITLVDLYKDVLIELDKHESLSAGEKKISIPFLGGNRRKIALVVDYREEAFLPAGLLQFLGGILGACNLTLDDVAIVNKASLSTSAYDNWNAHLKSNVIMLFGMNPESIGVPLHFPFFQIQSFNNIRFLSSPSLEELENDKLLKSKLWLCLKNLFSI